MVDVEIIQSCALLTIGEGKRGNLLSIRTLAELHAVVDRLSYDAGLKSLVLLGKGERFFVAGADIAELAGLDGGTALIFARLGQSLFDKIAAMPKAVIAGVDGYCMGGGMDLLLACDYRIATARAIFAHPGARMGIITGFGGTVRLPAEIGRARARNIFLGGGTIDAEEALRVGLINRVVGDGDVRCHCLSIAESVAGISENILRSWKHEASKTTGS